MVKLVVMEWDCCGIVEGTHDVLVEFEWVGVWLTFIIFEVFVFETAPICIDIIEMRGVVRRTIVEEGFIVISSRWLRFLVGFRALRFFIIEGCRVVLRDRQTGVFL